MNKKWIIGIVLFVVLGFFAISKNCCRNGEQSRGLDIAREKLELSTLDVDKETVLENGLIKKIILVQPNCFQIRDDLDLAKDPFAAPVDSIEIADPKKTLESAGITFGKDTSAIYNQKTYELTVVNTREQLELIEAYTAALDWPPGAPKQIAVRVEIFEMPSLTALEVIESAASAGTHAAERNAIRKALGRGQVRLVNASTIIARSGQRAKIEDVHEFPLPLSKTASIKKEDENGNRPDWETRQIGTIFEVDPVLGADNFTIDLNFAVEHHTAFPDQQRTKSAYPATLHAKKITTQITTYDGASILVGSWKPTGKTEYERNDLAHLVFITANIQTPAAPVSVVPTPDCCAKE